MRYRMYGQDAISKTPHTPVDIDADTEAAARADANEMGIQVLKVERLDGVHSVAPSAAPAIPCQKARSGLGWLLIGIPLALAVGIGIGILLPSNPPRPSATAASLAAAVSKSGIHVEELKAVEDAFALVDERAIVVKYSGGDVDFWIDADAQGRKDRFDVVGLFAGRGDEKPLAPDQTVEGYLVLVRGPVDDSGAETWRLAHQRNVVKMQQSSTGVSLPFIEAKREETREDRQSSSESTSRPVWLWNAKRNRFMTTTSTSASFPEPLPAGQNVCLKEIKETRTRFYTDRATCAANVLGLIAPPTTPWSATAAVNGSGGPDDESVTIKVMCKVAMPKRGQADGR